MVTRRPAVSVEEADRDTTTRIVVSWLREAADLFELGDAVHGYATVGFADPWMRSLLERQ